MKITDIQQQKKNKDRVSIFVDKKYSFSLSKQQLAEQKLETEQTIDEARLQSLKQISEDGKLFDLLLKWLARRPRSIWETQHYLRGKKATKNQIEQFIDRLKKLRYLNDEEFAHSWVRSRRALKPTSHRKLRAELYQKKVDSKIIDKVLAEDETDEREVLRELVEKKQKQARYQDRQKLMAYLARKGFNYDDIKAVLDESKD